MKKTKPIKLGRAWQFTLDGNVITMETVGGYFEGTIKPRDLKRLKAWIEICLESKGEK